MFHPLAFIIVLSAWLSGFLALLGGLQGAVVQGLAALYLLGGVSYFLSIWLIKLPRKLTDV